MEGIELEKFKLEITDYDVEFEVSGVTPVTYTENALKILTIMYSKADDFGFGDSFKEAIQVMVDKGELFDKDFIEEEVCR